MKSNDELKINCLQSVVTGEDDNYDTVELYENMVKIRMDARNFVPVVVKNSRISALVDSGADQCTLSVGMMKHVW